MLKSKPYYRSGAKKSAAAMSRALQTLSYRMPFKKRRGYVLNKTLSNKIHFFKRTTEIFYLSYANSGSYKFSVEDTGSPPPYITNTAFNASGGTGLQTGFIGLSIMSRLTDVINPAEFTSLFDSYMMLGTKVSASRVCGDVNVASDNRYNALPEIMSVVDQDDNAAPTSLANVLQYETLKVRKLHASNTFSRYIRPKIAEQAFKTSGTTIGFVHRGKNPWVDATYDDVEHYGHKFIINNLLAAPSGDSSTIRFIVTHYFACKSVR